MSDFYNFIWSEEEVKKFVSILAPLKQEEAYFLSMSARNKYLTEEERRFYELGRTEMFARKLVKNTKKVIPLEDTYLRILKSMQVSRGGYTSRTGKDLPDKCLVCYANINPSSGLKALKMFENKVTDVIFDFRSNVETESFFGHLDSLLMNCYQKAKGNKTLIDIDFDIPVEGLNILKTFTDILKKNQVTYYVIDTKSGYHVLLKNDNIGFNFHEDIVLLHKEAQNKFGVEHVEIVINSNGMVPVPGTMQAGYAVKFMEDSI